ncbi:MAG: hypothetical protein PF541_13200 [Prolixibacteraceae bacterium]|jgi:protein CpxP|nr:hypothetical protein [Prolixibacteraceae bacterium]
MKIKSIFLVLGIVISMLSVAQGPGGQRPNFDPDEMVKRQTDEMVENLGLSDEQAIQVKALNEKYGKKMGEAFQNAGEDRSSMRETMQTIRKEKDAELMDVLTEEQFTKYQDIEKKRREDMRQRRQENRDNPAEKRGRQRGVSPN